jgi:hypothetical protein
MHVDATMIDGRAAHEAAILGRYVVDRNVDHRSIELYVRARPASATGVDARIERFAFEHRWTLGALDAALALCRPKSPLRKKLILMTAILEACPEYCDEFLSKQTRGWPAFAVLGALIRAAVRALFGLLLLWTIR